jgi:hypothetical protein
MHAEATRWLVKRPAPLHLSGVLDKVGISAFFAVALTVNASCTSDSDTSPTPQKCRSALARQYDPAHKCFLPAATLPEFSFCKSIASGSTGTGEFECLLGPSGLAYRTWKDYGECLTTDAPGWSLYGLQGTCAQSVESDPNSVCNQVLGSTTDGPPVAVPGTSCTDT